MPGGGGTDATASAQADINIAVGCGSDIAAETAGTIMANSNPKGTVSLILFVEATQWKMIQNSILAWGYIIVAAYVIK
jgi:P-type Cu2+ transporter